MKSFFTKLGTLLLCGVAVAVVGCTDFSQDIQAVDKKVDDLTQNTETDLATINKALKDLEAKITADFATKKEVADLKATLEGSLASQVEALTGQINDVNDALKAAESKVNAAVAELDSKKADKTAVDAAIADAKAAAEKAVTELQGKLEAAQAELEKEIEGVTAEIADVQKNLDEAKAELEKKLAEGDAALQEDIDQAHAKADQLFGQLEALAPYLETLQAQILENKGTLDALSAYLPELKAELEEEIDNVDAKALELKNDLLSLTAHLKEYEAANDAKVLELKGTLDALSAHLEEYENTTDAKLTELQNTFFALSAYLEEQFAAIEAADDAIYEEIASNFATTNSAITALNNLLEDLQGEMKAADDAIYEEIASNFAATNSAITALNNLLEDLTAEYKAADDAIYAEMAANFATTNEAISSVYAQHLELAARVDGIDASLKAQIAAFEAFKAAYEEKVEELEATDTDLYGQYTALQEAITSVNNLIEDLQKEDENLASEINGVRENLTQLMNSINDRIDSEVEALKADALQKFNGLISIIAATEDRMNDKFEHVFDIVAELDERVAANESAIAALKQTVEMLEMWAEAHGTEYNQLTQYVDKIFTITGEIEERVGALEVEDGKIYEYIGETATNLNNLIGDVNADLEELWAEVAANKQECGAAVLALQNLIEDLEETLTGRIAALENRVDKIEIDIEGLKAALKDLNVALEEGLAETLEEAFKNDEGVMGNVRAFEEKVSNIVEKLNAKDAQIDSTHAADIAAIVVTLGEIKAELADIAEWQDGINTTINQLSEELWEAIGLQETALENAKTDLENAYKAADEAIKEQIEDGLAEVIAAAIAGDEKLDAKINDLVGKIQTEFNQKIQSVVYVPELGMEMPAQAFQFDSKPIEGSKVYVNGKFQVEPAGLISQIENGNLSVAFRLVETKAYTTAPKVELIFNNTDKAQGIFEVKAIFDAKDYPTDPTAAALFVYDAAVAAPKGDEVSIDFSNAVTSEYVKIVDNPAIDIKSMYILTKWDAESEKYVDWKDINDVVQWSATDAVKTPFEGYNVMIKGLVGAGEYSTIEEAAAYMSLDKVDPIKPVLDSHVDNKVAIDLTTFHLPANIQVAASYKAEATCAAIAVTGNDLNKTFNLAKADIKNAEAKDYVGHRAEYHPEYKVGTVSVLHPKYSYTVDYRTINITLKNDVTEGAHRLDWTYNLVRNKLTSSPFDVAHLYDVAIDKNLADQYKEYAVINEYTGNEVNYKDIIDNFTPVTSIKYTVNGKTTETKPAALTKDIKLEIVPGTSVIAPIASFKLTDYEFIGDDVTYNFTQTFTDNTTTFTKVNAKFDFTLGHKPMKVLVETPVQEISLMDGNWEKAIDFAALTFNHEAIMGHGLGADGKYNAYDHVSGSYPIKEHLYASTNPATELTKHAGTFLYASSGKVGIGKDDMKAIFLNDAAGKAGYIERIVETWYGTEFTYKVPFTVSAPAYKLIVNEMHVDANNVANVNAMMDGPIYTVRNSLISNYFKVVGADNKNEIKVRFTINDKINGPKFVGGSGTYTHLTAVKPDGTFAVIPEIQWGTYEKTTATVTAQLRVNGEDFLDPITVTLTTIDPLELTGKTVEKTWVPNENTPVADVREGATVLVKMTNRAVTASAFANNASGNLAEKAAAYGPATVTSTLKGVYYKNAEGNIVPVDATYYTFSSNTLTLKKESADLQVRVYAEFEITLDYTLDGGVPKTTTVIYAFSK